MDERPGRNCLGCKADGLSVLAHRLARLNIGERDLVAQANRLANLNRSPGQLQSHYAPRAAMRLNAREARPGETLLGFGAVNGARLNLSPRGDLKEAAANLFAMLRELDQGAAAIAVSPIPQEGLGEAINDRLMRAAAPRNLP